MKRIFNLLLSWLVTLISILSFVPAAPVSAAKPPNTLPPGYQGKRPTNEQREAAGIKTKIDRTQAAAKGLVSATLTPTPGGVPDYFGQWPNFALSPLPTIAGDGTIVAGSGIRKFLDSLPGIGPAGINNLGQYIPVATPDIITYPGADYYEIAAVQYTVQMHSDLPPTTSRGYVQINYGTNMSTGQNTVAPARVQYMGPAIAATRDRPVRIKLVNLLPTTEHIWLPSDMTVMGAGMGPNGGMETYADTRAGIHLHGGMTPWVSDGTPHQWITPNLQNTSYPKGVSVADVSDMPVSPGGSLTLYYPNQQSSRLMFYHDHAYGITRLNVYDGLAAPYLLTDPVEQALIAGGTASGPFGSVTVPAGGVIPATQIPLVIQDRTFVPGAAQLAAQDPTWDTTKWGGLGSLWYPHVYMPNQNPFAPEGVTAMGRWDYGPWFGAVGTINGPVANEYYDPNAPWEPPQRPGVPNVSQVAETFFDTPIVNGTVYPTLSIDPKAYRFRILAAGDDRFLNLSLIEAAPLTISITTTGSGYTSPPTVSITGGSVSGATAAASLGVVSYNVTNGGSGYTSSPTVRITGNSGSGAHGEAILSQTGSVQSILVVYQGSGYSSVPTVTISGGGGSGAQASAVLGVVGVNIVNRGTASSGAISNPTVSFSGGGGSGAAAIASVLSDVSMVPAVVDPNIPFPIDWVIPTDVNVVTPDILDGRVGGVPDPRYLGPDWVVIGNEGGWLPAPTVIPPSPIGYQHNNKNATWNSVTKKSLYLSPAERFDVIVDFSAFAGKTLILYNDAPAPAPLFDVRNDYYTNGRDQTAFGGPPPTLAGYGPNTRTVMQIRVSNTTPQVYDPAPLDTVIPAAYKAVQDPPLIPASVYNAAYGANYPDDYVRVRDAEFSPATTGQGVDKVIVAAKNIVGWLTSVPSVILTGGGGTGATAVATMLSQGELDAFVIGNPGHGYTSPPTVIISPPPPGGTQAVAEAEIQSGEVVAIDIINPGSGYIYPPTVTIVGGGGTGAQASVDIGTAFLITNPGTGYTSVPTINLSAPPGGTAATAQALLGVSSVNLVTTGDYPSYSSPPTITVTGGGGTGALLVPVMAPNPNPGNLGGGFSVVAVTVVSPGGGYTSPPTITFSGGDANSTQASATAILGLAGINIISGPSANYTAPPTVTITGGGGGSGAAATAINKDLTSGLLGHVTVTNAGSGYTTAPMVTFSGGGGAANTVVAYATLLNTPNYSLQSKLVFANFERYYGRLSMQLGVGPLTGYGYVDPVTEVFVNSITPGQPVAGDGTQIWRISHFGVDSHPLHWHLFNLQIINRIQIDGTINPPAPEEMGWKETIRINPLEDLVVAARPTAPKMPFNVMDSIRPLSPADPLGATYPFTNVGPGGAITSITNQLTNFGWEYVWHCHILSHEENDMMRPISFMVTSTVPPAATGVTVTTAGGNTVNWNDPTPAAANTTLGNTANEVGFQILRSPFGTGNYSLVGTVPANRSSFVDATVTAGTRYSYIVTAYNQAGSSNSTTYTMPVGTGSVAPPLPAAPALNSPAAGTVFADTAPIPFSWTPVAGADSYTLQVLSGSTVMVNMPGLISTTIVLPDSLLSTGNYTWVVSASGPAGTSPNSTARSFYVSQVSPPLVVTNIASFINATSAMLNGNLTSLGTAANVSLSFEYGLTTAYGSNITGTPASLLAPGNFSAIVSGLTPGTLYHFRARADANGLTAYGADQNFTTTIPGLPPVVVTNQAASINTSVATLNGNLTSLGTATNVSVSFEYGLNTTYGSNISGTPSSLLAPGNFSAVISGLTPGTLYHFRAKADVNGTASYGADQSFTTAPLVTPPVVVTNPASNISTSGATLNGNLTSLGTATNVSVSFEYGLNTTYGSNISGTPSSLLAPGNFSAVISGLTPGTLYHFRVKAVVNGTASYGADQTFSTSINPLTKFESYYAVQDNTGMGLHAAQTFSPLITHTLTQVKLNMFNEGATGYVSVSLRAVDASGLPTGPNLVTSLPIANSGIGTDWTTVTFNLGIGYQVQAGTTYALQINSDTSGLGLQVDTTGTYPRGRYLSANNAQTWWNTHANAWDIWFEEWGYSGGGPTIFTITAAAGTGGNISPSGTVTVNQGGNQTFTITPANGYSISNVLVDNISVGVLSSYTFTSINANHTITANFTPVTVLTITTASLASGQVGTAYSQTLIAAGGVVPYIWSVQNGTLPLGLSLNSTTGVISGTPTAAGLGNITFNVTDSAFNTATKILSLTISSSNGTLALYEKYYAVQDNTGMGLHAAQTFSPLITHTLSQVKLQIFNGGATGYVSVSLRAVNGSGLPTGPNLATSLPVANSGIPSAWTTVTFNLGAGYQVQAGTTYALQINSDTSGLSLQVDTTGTYPRGRYLSANNAQTWWNIHGNAWDIWFEEWGYSGVGPTIFTITAAAGTGGSVSPTAAAGIGGSVSPTAAAGIGGSISPSGTITVNRGGNQTFTITPGNGYSISNVLVDNNPVGAVSSYTFTSINSNHTITASFAQATILTITTNSLANGQVGMTYNQTLTAAGGVAPYIWSVKNETLPSGLSLNSTTGEISGTPNTAGLAKMTFKITDSKGDTATKVLYITFSNGTDGMLALYESYYAAQDKISVGLHAAQTFIPLETHILTQLKVRMLNGGATGYVSVSLRAVDSSGLPTGPNLSTSAPIANSGISSDWTDVIFNFGAGYQVQAGTTYALQINSDTNGLNLQGNTNGTYQRGRYLSANNPQTSWNTHRNAWDIWFEEWGTP